MAIRFQRHHFEVAMTPDLPRLAQQIAEKVCAALEEHTNQAPEFPAVESFGSERIAAELILAGLTEARTGSPEEEALAEALEKSVALQNHYAELLNMHDGGTRLTFSTAQAWLDRLSALSAPENTRPEAAHSVSPQQKEI